MKTILSWSSGKDSAWALHRLQSSSDHTLQGLCTTINAEADRVAMHAVRRELLEQQARSAGLPLDIVPLPDPCTNDDYESAMSSYFSGLVARGVDCIAFGDLHLQDVRDYRERMMQGSGLLPLFPIWGMDTRHLAREMLAAGLRARVTCVDPKQLPGSFAGREFDATFLDDLPEAADPCGENGEFHSFAYAGPMFTESIRISSGDTIERDGFIFTDLLPA